MPVTRIELTEEAVEGETVQSTVYSVPDVKSTQYMPLSFLMKSDENVSKNWSPSLAEIEAPSFIVIVKSVYTATSLFPSVIDEKVMSTGVGAPKASLESDT